MEVVQQVLDDDHIVPIKTLSDLGRQSLRSWFANQSDISISVVEQLWRRLRATASSSAVTDKHLSAACNAVCVFINGAQQVRACQVSEFAYSDRLWFEAFGIVHKAFNDGKNKPAMQVMDALVDVLQRSPDRTAAIRILQKAINETIQTLLSGEPEIHLKQACIILLHLLRRTVDLIPFAAYLESVTSELQQEFRKRCLKNGISLKLFDTRLGDPLEILFLSLLFAVQLSSSRSAALKLFAYLCSAGEKHDYKGHAEVASQVIKSYLSANIEILADFSREVFPVIVSDESQLQTFMTQYSPAHSKNRFDLDIFLTVVQVGRTNNLIKEIELPAILDNALSPRTESVDGFRTLLRCNSSHIRLQAYNLLTMSNSTNALIPGESLSYLVQEFIHLHDDADAFYRDEIVNISRRFMRRIEKSAHALWREKQNSLPAASETSGFGPYDSFLSAYLRFLLDEYGPQVSYSRHVLALHILRQILELESCKGIYIEWASILRSFILPLLNLVTDAFEDVRSMASLALLQINVHHSDLVSSTIQGTSIVRNAKVLSSTTNRSDHADALGRLYLLSATVVSGGELLDNRSGATEKTIADDLIHEIYEYVLSLATLDPSDPFPLHGNLLGIMYQLDHQCCIDYQFAKSLLEICTKIWHLVQTELCVDSPERTTEAEERDEGVGPKDLLAYSWRALRDSSLVIQAVVRNCKTDRNGEICIKAGSLCLEQLITLRHRGAFSTVAQTFLLCCQNVRAAGNDNARAKILEWQKTIFFELDAQAAKLTRRSAGLPALFAGILDPSDTDQFDDVVKKLVDIATLPPNATATGYGSEVRLPQVHAHNCLKDIMTHSRFRVISEPLVLKMLNISAQSLASDVWAIRNCGLMLFRACINRLTAEISMTSILRASQHYARDRVESPLSIAIGLLHTVETVPDHIDLADSSMLSEIVFAALDLLGRIPNYAGQEDLVNSLFEQQLGNNLWAVRDYAAELRASNVRTGEAATAAAGLLTSLQSTSTANEVHGRILCCRYIGKRLWASPDTDAREEETLGLISTFTSFAQSKILTYWQPNALAAWLDILNDGLAVLSSNTLHATNLVKCVALLQPTIQASISILQTCPLLRRAILLSALYCRIFEFLQHLDITNITVLVQRLLRDNLLSLIIVDDDAVNYALQALVKSKLPEAVVLRILITFATQITSVNVQSSCLRFISENMTSEEVSQLPIMESLVQGFSLSTAVSRERFDSEIGISAVFFSKVAAEDVHRHVPKMHLLVDAIRLALQESTETSTRLNVASAISNLASLINSHSNTTDALNAVRLKLLLVLYKLLNDDDEDVRALAAHATGQVWPTTRIPYICQCSAASRKLLRGIAFDKFAQLPEFTAEVLLVAFGIETSAALDAHQMVIAYCEKNPVHLLMRHAIRRANDLFAEEKQNLYIDVIQEIYIWIGDILSCRIDFQESNIKQALQQWTINGLSQLTALTERENQGTIEDGLLCLGSLGPSFSEEIFSIFTYVIAMARLLLGFKDDDIDKKLLQEQMVRLREACNNRVIQDRIRSEVEQALIDL